MTDDDNRKNQDQDSNSSAAQPSGVVNESDNDIQGRGTAAHNADSQPHRAPRRRRMTIADRWMVFLTAVIATGGIVSAIIFGFQLRAMNGQLNEMQVQSAITKSQMRASIRANIVAAPAIGKDNALIGFYLTPVFQNPSPTEAREFRGWDSGHIFATNIPPSFDFSRTFAEQDAPTQTFSIAVTVPPNGQVSQGTMTISIDDIEKAMAGSQKIYIWFYEEYRDIFPDTPMHHISNCSIAVPFRVGSEIKFSFPVYKEECNYSN